MSFRLRLRRRLGWVCFGLVAAFLWMGYHFGNVRFLPIAAGFAILSGLCLIVWDRREVASNAIHPGADSGVTGAGRG